MTTDSILLPRMVYRNVFLVQNRDYWNVCPYQYDKEHDLVLTFDFGLLREIEAGGGAAAYLDHLVASEIMERYNIEMYHFLENWYRDEAGKDIFTYKDIPFGNAFRLDIWNDVTYFVRMLVNVLCLKKLIYENLYAGLEDSNALDVIARLELANKKWSFTGAVRTREYYFPIFRWMQENIRPFRLRQRFRAMLSHLLDVAISCGELIKVIKQNTTSIYVQHYYPTAKIIEQLKQSRKVDVLLERYTFDKILSGERRVPVHEPVNRHREIAAAMSLRFPDERSLNWYIEDVCVSNFLYDTISSKVSSIIPTCLSIIDSIGEYFSSRPLKLSVTISNLGLVNCLVSNYCIHRGIPSYLIINGMILHYYPEEETKGITWINSFGEMMKVCQFGGMSNVVCLGDPRMDQYINNFSAKVINRSEPTILIGAGGFSNIDLNSYSACEFVFLHGILQACRILRGQDRKMNIILKVRANGYIEQYSQFIKEYFNEINIEVHDTVPFSQIIRKADLYISIYSGTFFEASCLGIPVLYYKSDTEILIPPYDGKSELVTAHSVDELVDKISLFYDADPIFNPFQNKQTMEKYIGPLDGRNLDRNMEFIYSLFESDKPLNSRCDKKIA